MKGTNQQVSLQWQKAAVSQCFQSKTEAETSTVCPALLWLSTGFLLQAYVKGKYQRVSLQWQKVAVSLFCQSTTGADASTVCPGLL